MSCLVVKWGYVGIILPLYTVQGSDPNSGGSIETRNGDSGYIEIFEGYLPETTCNKHHLTADVSLHLLYWEYCLSDGLGPCC